MSNEVIAPTAPLQPAEFNRSSGTDGAVEEVLSAVAREGSGVNRPL